MKHVVKKQDFTEAQEGMKQDMEILAERLLEEKYARPEYQDIALGIEEVYANPATRRRAINTMIKMDNHEKYFEKLSRYIPESTFTANFGATPQAIIRAIRVANPNSVIEDICDVQTLSSMVGIIGYIKPVFSRSIRGGVAGSLLVESKAKDYGAENIDQALDTGTGTQTLFTSTQTGNTAIAYLPIRAGKFQILSAGIPVAQDDGLGNLVNVTGGTAITAGVQSYVNYTTGAWSVKFAVSNTPANQAVVLANYNYDTEQNTDAHGDVELIWASEGVTAEMHPLNFKFSLTSMLLAESANFSVEEVLNDAATQYLKSERDRRGVEFNARLALGNPTISFDATPSANGDNNNKMHAQMLELKFETAANAMYELKNRGGISYIIAGSAAAAYMNLLDNFVKDNSHSPIGCYRVGYLGKAPVIKARTTNLATNQILVGYRSEWGEAPFIHCDYLDYATESLTLKDFITQKGLASYYVNKKVEPAFVRTITINNLPV